MTDAEPIIKVLHIIVVLSLAYEIANKEPTRKLGRSLRQKFLRKRK
jgi:hypothetical protein